MYKKRCEMFVAFSGNIFKAVTIESIQFTVMKKLEFNPSASLVKVFLPIKNLYPANVI